MANLAKYRTSNGGFHNDIETHRIVYDFSVDAGATGVLNIFMADQDVLLLDFMAVVKTTCTSGGSAVLDVGVTGDDDKLVDGIAVASLAAGAVFQSPLVEATPNTKQLPVKIASGEKILQTIVTAALTAGKIEYIFRIMKY